MCYSAARVVYSAVCSAVCNCFLCCVYTNDMSDVVCSAECVDVFSECIECPVLASAECVDVCSECIECLVLSSAECVDVCSECINVSCCLVLSVLMCVLSV